MSTRKLTTDQFIERSKQIHGTKFSYEKTVYVNSKTSVTITCEHHGDIDINPNNHINHKSGCPHCYGKTKKTTQQFIQQVKDVHGENSFTYDKTEYCGDGKNVIITCSKHGDFFPKPTNILRGSGCPKCYYERASVNNRKPVEMFIEEAIKIHGTKYDYSLVEYVNSSTRVKIICPIHGIFLQQPTVHVTAGCGCPICKSSKGEKEVKEWLESKNITFEQQKTFPECKDKKKLRFDFFLPKYNILIEYNGAQHYKPVKFLEWSLSSLEDIKNKDKIKHEFAKKVGLRLLVIPYTMDVKHYLDLHLQNPAM